MGKVLLKDFVFSEEMMEMYDIKMDLDGGDVILFKPNYITLPIEGCIVDSDDTVVKLKSNLFSLNLWIRHRITHLVIYKPVCS